MAEKGISRESVKTVYSKPQALAQCQRFLKQVNRKVVPVQSIADTVKLIREKKAAGAALVAGKRAAKAYGLRTVAGDIEDSARNITRFFIIGEKDSEPTGRDKTSIVFASSHESGSLHKAINEFAKRGINITRIESRPTRENPWEYNFFLDCEGHRQDKQVHDALEDLRKVTFFVKVLGSYPRAE
jgi:chorismate mutase/prephenate dehydratase